MIRIAKFGIYKGNMASCYLVKSDIRTWQQRNATTLTQVIFSNQTFLIPRDLQHVTFLCEALGNKVGKI